MPGRKRSPVSARMPHRISAPADEDLRLIYLRGADQFGIDVADRYAAQLRRAFELLGNFPELARRREEVTGDVRAYPIGAHIIIYQIDPDGVVQILRIRHGREDWLTGDY